MFVVTIIYIQNINKLYWRKTEGNTTVCFSNSPFTVDCEIVLDCQYEPHYWKDKEPQKQLCLQRSRNIGCHAHIKIHYYTVYRDYQLCSVSFMTPRKLQDHKREYWRNSDPLLLLVKWQEKSGVLFHCLQRMLTVVTPLEKFLALVNVFILWS